MPPTIVFGLPAGSAAVEPSGALAVFPGSILHLECLFARKLGNPEWTWTSTFRQYLTGTPSNHRRLSANTSICSDRYVQRKEKRDGSKRIEKNKNRSENKRNVGENKDRLS